MSGYFLTPEETEAPLQDDTDTEEIVISSSELVPKTSGSDDAMEIIISSGEGDFISSPSLLSPSKAYAERPPEIKRFKPDSGRCCLSSDGVFTNMMELLGYMLVLTSLHLAWSTASGSV